MSPRTGWPSGKDAAFSLVYSSPLRWQECPSKRPHHRFLSTCLSFAPHDDRAQQRNIMGRLHTSQKIQNGPVGEQAPPAFMCPQNQTVHLCASAPTGATTARERRMGTVPITETRTQSSHLMGSKKGQQKSCCKQTKIMRSVLSPWC